MEKDMRNKMLNLYLARHGQDEDNASGILNGQRDMPLSSKGIEQAKDLAENIKKSGLKFDHIYSSPLQRASKTAEIISKAVGVDYKILPELIERDYGDMTGQIQARIEELCAPDILKTDTVTYFLKPNGGESFPNLIERANALLELIRQKHTEGNILLVGHGDFGKMIYCAYYNLNWQDVLKNFHFGNSDMLKMSSDSKPDDTHVFRFKQYNV